MARKRTAITFGVALWLLALAAATAGITSAETTPPAGARLTEEGWFAKPVTTAAKPALPEEITRAFVIPIREPISEKTFKAMRRKVISCKSTAAELVVFDMDTWGGDAIAALDIARMMKTDLKNIYTVCYVRTRAISAGALIAMSCDEIVMTPVGAFGDCAPISMGQKLEGVEREKIETELRREFRESSKRNGYHVALAQSMVSHDLEVWLIRNKKTSELRYVLEEEWKGRVDIPHAVKPTLTNPKSDWLFVRTVVSKGKLLTVDAAEAREYGFIRHIIDPPEGKPLSGLMEHYNVKGEPTILADTWSEKLVGFLTSPVLSGILFFVAIIALYTELNTPGFGVAGTIAIICFSILFGSRFLIGLAAWWEIALFIVGLILIATEVFVTPGFGVLGVSGLLCCIVSLLAMIIPNAPGELPIPETPLDWSMLSNGAFALAVGFVFAVIAAIFITQHLPKIPIANKLFLKPAESVTQPPVSESSPMMRIRVGDVGVVEGMCRPVGKVRFGEELLDASSEGETLEAGAMVRVLRRDGNRLIVEKAREA